MRAVPSQRRNHSQANAEQGKNKKPGGKNSSRNRSSKRHSRAAILQEVSPDQQPQCQLGKFFRNANQRVLPRPTNQNAWGGIQQSVLTGLSGDANFSQRRTC